jgi:2-methylcitrate dehydratase
VFFKDGTKTPLSEVLYPLGHRNRRKEGMPVLMSKFEMAVGRVFAAKRRDAVVAACADAKRLEAMPVNEFMDLLAV